MSQPVTDLWAILKKSAIKLDNPEAHWLVKHQEPVFDILDEQGSRIWSEQDKKSYSDEHARGRPEMLLLHGLFGALSNWNTTIPLFSKFTQPLALHFPILSGHRSEVKVKALAMYTEYFIRKNFTKPVILCGNSMGGHVALRVCLTSPELVDCLILSGSSGLYEHSVDALPIRPDAKFVRDHMSRVFFNPQHITDDTVNEIADILKSKMRTLNLIHAARSAKKDNLQTLLPQIKVPTLLLWGENDEVTTPAIAEQFHKLIPHSKLITMKNCGHAPMIEYPEWFTGQVQQFLVTESKAFKK